MCARYRKLTSTNEDQEPCRFIHFFLGPFEDRCDSFATAFRDGTCLTTFMPTFLNHIAAADLHLRDLTDCSDTVSGIYIDEVKYAEILHDPDQPFYINPSPWLPAGSTANAIPVFYLTNKLTKKEDKALKAEIATITDEDQYWKECCFVPWKTGKDGEADGTVEDMWEIFWMACTHDGGRNNAITIFFIDRQSGSDLKTIVVTPNHYFSDVLPDILKGIRYPTLRGFSYGRIPGRESHTVPNPETGNMGFDKFLELYNEEERKFPRPGWPGHGVLSS